MRVAGAVVLCSLWLAGCAVELTELLFARPGQFDYLSCEDIAKSTQKVAAREEELRILTERAEKETFGALMAATSYRSEHLRAQGQLKLLAEAAGSKNCPSSPASVASPGTQATPRR